MLKGQEEQRRASMNTGLEQPEAHPGEDGPAPRGPKFVWYKDRVLLLTVPAVLAIDQLTKYLVRTNLRVGESWPGEGTFRITHGLNTGTAFGLFPNQTLLLVIASFIAIGFLYYFYRTHALPSRLLRFAIGLQLGGAFGNLLDRLRTGAVVDFIGLGWWPIFNLADSSIVLGMSLLVALMLLSSKESRQPGQPAASEGQGVDTSEPHP